MKRAFAVASIIGLAVFRPIPASAGAEVDPSELSPELFIEAERDIPPTVSAGGPTQSGQPAATGPTYEPVLACQVDPEVGIYGCRTVDPADPDNDDDPELTPGDVLRAVRDIGLPSLQVQVQPGTATLVNVDTIFHTQPQPFERSVDLLGFDVDVVAEPASYQWIHGDGTQRTTTRPGRPYPATDVTHRYTRPADSVQARVDVTYRVRYRVDGGPWQTIDQTLTATGPVTALRVDEAAPVLAAP